MTRVSSWSSPCVLRPFWTRVPTTVSGMFLTRNRLAERVGAGKEVLGHVLPDHDHLGRLVDILLA